MHLSWSLSEMFCMGCGCPCRRGVTPGRPRSESPMAIANVEPTVVDVEASS